jgi:putative nucleotidyltransferase with HDIG domain
MDEITVKNYLISTTELPTLPEVALQVMRKINHPDSSAADIVQIIDRDPAMTAKILKVANSAYYGMVRRVDSLRMAVVILGFRQCASLVMGMSVFKGFSKHFPGDLTFYYDLWRHLISTAQVSSKLADKFHLSDPSMVYTGGLLHDLGKILLHIKFVQQYPLLIQHSKETSEPLAELEKGEFQVGHDTAGGWLITKWEFPSSLVNILSNHHSLNSDMDMATEVATVALANCFCRQEMLGYSGNHEEADFLTHNAWAPLFSKGWGKNLSERKTLYQELYSQKDRIQEMTEGFLEVCAANG